MDKSLVLYRSTMSNEDQMKNTKPAQMDAIVTCSWV
jgi:hypothetical protein